MNPLDLQVHLTTHTTARLMMNHEYIVPMTAQARAVTLYPSSYTGDDGGIPNCSHGSSLKPQMNFSSPSFVKNDASEGNDVSEIAPEDSPGFPLDVLRSLTVQMLTEAVFALGQDVRDPVGGDTELLLVPLIKLVYALLVMGVLEDEDLGKVLRLLDSRVFLTRPQSPADEEKEDESDDDEEEYSDSRHQKDDSPNLGLLQMNLPEAVKLEVSEPQLSHATFVDCLNILNKPVFSLRFIPSSVTCCPTCVIVRCGRESKLWLLSLTLLCRSCRRTSASATTKSCRRSICLLLLLLARPRSSAHLHRSRLEEHHCDCWTHVMAS